MVETFFSPSSRKPGLQTVFENWYGTNCRQRWEQNADIPYAGMGTLHNGGLGSPTQFMLDLEIRKAQWTYKHDIPLTDDTLNFDGILDVCNSNGNFLMSDHTVSHCRDLWNSPLFLSDAPIEGGWDGSEKSILDKCDEMWRDNLAKWQAPEWPEDKLKAMDALVERARREFGAE
jgi:trimethylamine:corrinoid methyltransferase-like protein